MSIFSRVVCSQQKWNTNMDTKVIGRTFLGPLMVVILPFALFSQEQVQKGRVQVTVSNPNGAPVRNAEVTVRNESGEYDESASTNSNGVAQLSNVPRGAVRILVTARGFKNFGGHEALTHDRLVLSIRLEKDGTSAPSPSPSPSTTP